MQMVLRTVPRGSHRVWIGFQLGIEVDCCGLPPYRGCRVVEIEWKRVQEDVDLHAELA